MKYGHLNCIYEKSLMHQVHFWYYHTIIRKCTTMGQITDAYMLRAGKVHMEYHLIAMNINAKTWTLKRYVTGIEYLAPINDKCRLLNTDISIVRITWSCCVAWSIHKTHCEVLLSYWYICRSCGFMNWRMFWIEWNTMRCRYNAVNCLTTIHKRHPIARPLGWGIGCLV